MIGLVSSSPVGMVERNWAGEYGAVILAAASCPAGPGRAVSGRAESNSALFSAAQSDIMHASMYSSNALMVSCCASCMMHYGLSQRTIICPRSLLNSANAPTPSSHVRYIMTTSHSKGQCGCTNTSVVCCALNGQGLIGSIACSVVA